MSKQGYAALFATADFLEECGISYQMAHSGQTLRCYVVQPRDWVKLEAALWRTHPSEQKGQPVVRNTEDFREHVRRQNWRLSEWQ